MIDWNKDDPFGSSGITDPKPVEANEIEKKITDPPYVESKTVEVKPKAEVNEDPRRKRILEIMRLMHDIEKEYDGISNIPVNHKYYGLRTELDVLNAK